MTPRGLLSAIDAFTEIKKTLCLLLHEADSLP